MAAWDALMKAKDCIKVLEHKLSEAEVVIEHLNEEITRLHAELREQKDEQCGIPLK